jgi:hypothetical protein
MLVLLSSFLLVLEIDLSGGGNNRRLIVSNIVPLQSLEVQRIPTDQRTLMLTSHQTTWNGQPIFDDADAREACANELLRRKKEIRDSKLTQIIEMLDECCNIANNTPVDQPPPPPQQQQPQQRLLTANGDEQANTNGTPMPIATRSLASSSSSLSSVSDSVPARLDTTTVEHSSDEQQQRTASKAKPYAAKNPFSDDEQDVEQQEQRQSPATVQPLNADPVDSHPLQPSSDEFETPASSDVVESENVSVNNQDERSQTGEPLNDSTGEEHQTSSEYQNEEIGEQEAADDR